MARDGGEAMASCSRRCLLASGPTISVLKLAVVIYSKTLQKHPLLWRVAIAPATVISKLEQVLCFKVKPLVGRPCSMLDCWAYVLVLGPSSSYLLVKTLGDSRSGFNVESLLFTKETSNELPGSGLWPNAVEVIIGIWGLNQWVIIFSLSLPSSKQINWLQKLKQSPCHLS